LNQLGFGNIAKIVATRCHILQLKCTKFDFGWAPPQTPLGELTAPYRSPTSKGSGGKGEGGGRGGGEGKGAGEGRDPCFWVTPPEIES